MTQGTVTITDYLSGVATGNAWTAITGTSVSYGGTTIQLYYCLNPTVGASHTFRVASSNNYCSIGMMAFSGATRSPITRPTSPPARTSPAAPPTPARSHPATTAR